MAKSKVKAPAARSAGRPASFPNVQTAAFMATIPLTTRQMVREFAGKREININQAMDQLIQRGFRESTR